MSHLCVQVCLIVCKCNTVSVCLSACPCLPGTSIPHQDTSNAFDHTSSSTPDPVPISEVKSRWACSVLGWGTTREAHGVECDLLFAPLPLPALFLFYFWNSQHVFFVFFFTLKFCVIVTYDQHTCGFLAVHNPNYHSIDP